MMQASRIASSAFLPSCSRATDGEVDHHDAVLLDQADEHDDADKGVDRQLGLEQQQGQQRPETGEGQGGEDGQRVDEALVEDAENDIDDDDRQEPSSQPMLAWESWNCWALPWKVDWMPSGRAAVSFSRSLERPRRGRPRA